MMASYLDKTQVNTAITDNTKLDLGHTHVTTMDFMQLNVAMIQELVPGSKIDVKMESFARLNPLVVPTFGRAAMRNRAFWVPMRTIFRGWNDYITDSVHVASDGYISGQTGSILSSVPTVTMGTLCGAFLNSVGQSSTGAGMIYQVAANQNNDNWDFFDVAGGVTTFYCYTVRGRQCLKLLESLGYKLDWDADKDLKLNALPLLALAKIYVDWYFPQQYSNLAVYDELLAICNLDVNAGPLTLSQQHVQHVLNMCSYVQYDSDLFVSAWDQPNSPNVGNYSGSDFKLVNLDTVGSIYGSNLIQYNMDMNGVSNKTGVATNTSAIDRLGNATAPFITPYVNGSSTSGGNVQSVTAPISEYLLHGLHAMTDYMKRHQLAGSRAFDRYLARFGKALPSEKINRCNYLGAAVQDIQIGDVMSTSDTISSAAGSPSGKANGAQLGSYAGKGMSYGNGHFDFSTDEFGYFIVLSSIVPATGYFQGIDPMMFRIHKTDYWTPEYENLGVEPIKAANLFIPQVPGQMTGDPYEQIFGYVPRYAAYKTATCSDRLTGNFRVPSINQGAFLNGGNAWHLMRTFDTYDFNGDWTNVVHSPDFISGKSDFKDYKRLFYEDAADSPDNFTVIHNFEIAEYAPMKPLYDTYEFEDKGKKVTLETNGVKMN